MNSRRLHVVILIILLILITSMGVYFFIASSVFRPSLPSRISTEDYSEGVAAVVNNEKIGETAVSSYIKDFRDYQGLQRIDDWAQWLIRQGYTPETFRNSVLEKFISIEPERQYARNIGIEINQTDIDNALYRQRLQYDEVSWRRYLQEVELGVEDIRRGNELLILDEAICKETGFDCVASSEEVLSYAKENLFYTGDIKKIEDLPAGIVKESRDIIVSSKRAVYIENLLKDYRDKSEVAVYEAPEAPCYGVDLNLYKSENCSEFVSRLNRRISENSLSGKNAAEPLTNETEIEEELNRLRKINPDVYAWLYIPNTNISYPVAQHSYDDAYYLTHNAEKIESSVGTVFSEKINSKDFDDSVTVLYGHSFVNAERMFTQLHRFLDEDFFSENEQLFIYRKGHVFEYRVVAAYMYDNRHILTSFDFNKPETVQGYFDYVCSGLAQGTVRGDISLVASSDKLLQLSTCVLPADDEARFIVSAVYVGEDPL